MVFPAGPVEKDKTEAPIMLDGPSQFWDRLYGGFDSCIPVLLTKPDKQTNNYFSIEKDILFTVVFLFCDTSRITGGGWSLLVSGLNLFNFAVWRLLSKL